MMRVMTPTPAMVQVTSSFPLFTIGLDLGDRSSYLVVVRGDGSVAERGKVSTTHAALSKRFARFAGARIVLEASTHSPWVAEHLASMGLETLVVDPRQMPLPSGRARQKTDRIDAEYLARMGRADPRMFRAVKHRGPEDRLSMCTIRLRRCLVEMRTQAINCVRGQLKSLGGIRVPKCSTPMFTRAARKVLPAPILAVYEPMLAQIDTLSASIKEHDRRVEHLAAKYPAVARLTQVAGVGDLTALTFVLTIQTPTRFGRSRTVGAYLGLVPRKSQSGDSDPQLSITKRGDESLRTLLVSAAHYIIGPLNKVDSDLRRYGLNLAGDGSNRIAKKRAVVAVARRLAVLLHALWRSGADYEPLRARRSRPALVSAS